MLLPLLQQYSHFETPSLSVIRVLVPHKRGSVKCAVQYILCKLYAIEETERLEGSSAQATWLYTGKSYYQYR